MPRCAEEDDGVFRTEVVSGANGCDVLTNGVDIGFRDWCRPPSFNSELAPLLCCQGPSFVVGWCDNIVGLIRASWSGHQ